MLILFYISDTFLSLVSLLHSFGCEFPNPSKIDHFTYLTETERPNDWVYLYDKVSTLSCCYCMIKLDEAMLHIPELGYWQKIMEVKYSRLYSNSGIPLYRCDVHLFGANAIKINFVWKSQDLCISFDVAYLSAMEIMVFISGINEAIQQLKI